MPTPSTPAGRRSSALPNTMPQMGMDADMVKLMSGKRDPTMMKQMGMDPSIMELMTGLSKMAGLMGGSRSCLPSPRSSSPSRPSSGPARRPRGP
eukprot:14276053-Alexandrium_andersonii.AAC.1